MYNVDVDIQFHVSVHFMQTQSLEKLMFSSIIREMNFA